MARSSYVSLVAGLLFFLAARPSWTKTVTYDFNVSWVEANPDGLFPRKVVGVNGQWPLPIINVDKGDQLVVKMYNGLGDKSASIHFHGMFQNGTNNMDGASMITQCPVAPGSSFTYNFTVNQNGTYWYHCHTNNCYPDGYRQALLVHDKDAPFANKYKEEFTLTLSDWYHDFIDDLSKSFLSLNNPTGAEPIPDSFLVNDTIKTNLVVEPNTTYLLRLINVAAFVGQYFYIEGHNFTIVEVDGVYTEPTEASLIYISAAQRYAVLLTTKNTTDQNYGIVTVADSSLLDTIPSMLQLNNTNWLEYNKDKPKNQAVINATDSTDLIPFDDISLVPYDHMSLLPDPDDEITVTVFMRDLDNGYNYAFLNNISYTPAKVPSLYTVLSSGNMSSNQEIYGDFTHSVVLEHNQVVQIVLNNGDTGSHPFHLHGHNFQVLTRTPSYGPDFYSLLNLDPVPFSADNHSAFPTSPMRRDTVVLPPHGNLVIRFVADNPGVWIFHCHIDWHLSSGLGMLLIEAPTQIQERVKIPQQQYDACKAAGVPYSGNAAANSKDFLNLSGQNVQAGWIPDGFTSRGIVAMVFSCLAAALGVSSLVVYGLADLKRHPDAAGKRRVHLVPADDTMDNNITMEIQAIDNEK